MNPPAPGKVEKAFGPTLFREGDRVMQVKNNYDVLWASTDGKEVGMGIFNGDIGQITAIDPSSGLVTVDFEGHLAQYTPRHDDPAGARLRRHRPQGPGQRVPGGDPLGGGGRPHAPHPGGCCTPP